MSLLHLCIVGWLAFGFQLTSSKYSKCTAWFLSIYGCTHSSWNGSIDPICPWACVKRKCWYTLLCSEECSWVYCHTSPQFKHHCYKSPLEGRLYFCVVLSIVMAWSVTGTLRWNRNRNDIVIKALGKFCSAGFLLLAFGFAVNEVMWKEHLVIYSLFMHMYKRVWEVQSQHLLHSYKL